MTARKGGLPEGSIMIETYLFEHREVKPHFINPCCFGEDFAAWLKRALLRSSDLDLEFSEPIQEDYGWGFWATHGKDRIWIALSYVGDGPQEPPAQWIVSVEQAKRLFPRPDRQVLEQLRDHIRQILSSDEAIKLVSA
jgi:hypothetical protein